MHHQDARREILMRKYQPILGAWDLMESELRTKLGMESKQEQEEEKRPYQMIVGTKGGAVGKKKTDAMIAEITEFIESNGMNKKTKEITVVAASLPALLPTVPRCRR